MRVPLGPLERDEVLKALNGLPVKQVARPLQSAVHTVDVPKRRLALVRTHRERLLVDIRDAHDAEVPAQPNKSVDRKGDRIKINVWWSRYSTK